jgi:tetratricopeptide (TPR) repeat protein
MKALRKGSMIAFAGLMMICGALLAQDELSTAYNELKAASDAKKSPAEIKTLAQAALAAVKKNQGPAPADVEKESWEARVKYAGEIQTQIEYIIYASAAAAPAAQAVDMFAYLEQVAPKSQYMGQAYPRYVAALQQAGQAAKVGPIAEKAVAAFPGNPQLLMMAADYEMARQGADRALGYAKQAGGIFDRTPKAPEGVPQAQWDTLKGTAHYYAGLIYGTKRQWAECDKELRPAMALIKGNAAFTANATFWLGEANYALGRQTMDRTQINQGMKYIEQAATLGGTYRDTAATELRRMKQEMGLK